MEIFYASKTLLNNLRTHNFFLVIKCRLLMYLKKQHTSSRRMLPQRESLYGKAHLMYFFPSLIYIPFVGVLICLPVRS